MNHLLSSDSISSHSGMFSSLYALPALSLPSRLSKPSARVTLTSVDETDSHVTKTFSRRCAQMRVGVVAIAACGLRARCKENVSREPRLGARGCGESASLFLNDVARHVFTFIVRET